MKTIEAGKYNRSTTTTDILNPAEMSSTIYVSTFPLSAGTPLGELTPTTTAVSINPRRKYVAYLTEKDNYIFVAMRFGAVCAALTRFDMTDSASKIGQFAVDLLGTGMFLTALEHYLGEVAVGDDLVSVKYCMADLIEDLEVHLDSNLGGGFGAELRKVVNEAGLTYDPGEIPDVVEMAKVTVVEEETIAESDDEEIQYHHEDDEDDDDYAD
ncbi:hypothetical protein PRZ48_011987 [Zasmidium cellare]|uniref:Uncharacterized protein n=1 Tax=Zasmidium cellare TaxID=395010 RepID=A0ABR0E7X7_ZASCE|nr:hypothetical protein PRZ48_011987 [Zasmidium cellare]